MHEVTPLLDAGLVRRAFDEAGASRWGLGLQQWHDVLARSVAGRFRSQTPSAGDVRAHVQSLHLDDLALAAACAEGTARAWDHFVLTFRPVLYRAADAARGVADARETADSIYGELFGLEQRDGQRRSLLTYYHGRSSLAGWLRSVLAQRLVDRVRATRRLVPFEEAGAVEGEEDRRSPTVGPTPGRADADDPAGADPHRPAYLAAIRGALAAAVGALDAGLRLRLALYYAQGMTLAAIGRVVGESEATVSRRLDRARRDIRAEVVRRLREEHHLDEAQVALAFEYAARDQAFDLRDVLPVPDS